MQGWIKLHRKLVDWEWYTDVPVKTLFIHLLLLVNHEPKQWRGQIIDRGACVTSVSSLAQGCGLSEQQTRTALNKLLSTHEINKQTTNKNTVVIVLNYSLYQGLIDNDIAENNKQITNTATNEQQAQQQTNNNKQEIKKIRNKEYKKESICTRFQKPSLDDIKSEIADKGYFRTDAQHFFDYYESNGWKVGKNPMKDWKKALANWERRQAEFKDKSKINTKPTYDTEKMSDKALHAMEFDI